MTTDNETTGPAEPALSGPVTPALDLTGYHSALVVKTGEVDGFVYKRGTTHTVDKDTLAKLRAASMIDEASIKTAA